MPTAHFTPANPQPKKGRGKKPRAKAWAQQPPQDTANAPEQGGWGNDGWVQVDLSGWAMPAKPANPGIWEKQGRIDKLRDTIPFWLKNVDAANNDREMTKMEEFLNQIYADEDRWNEEWANDQPAEGWPEANEWDSPGSERDTWAVRDDADVHLSWGPQANTAAWGIPEMTPGSNPWEPKSDPAAWGETVADDDSFIDKAARFENANTTKKKAMRQFYSVSVVNFIFDYWAHASSSSPPMRKLKSFKSWWNIYVAIPDSLKQLSFFHFLMNTPHAML